MTFVVITAGIDLSIVALATLAGMVLGLMFQAGWSWPIAVAASIAVGGALGLVNGGLIGVAGISFFVVTLGTLSIYQSIALVTTTGETITLYNYPHFSPIQSLVNDSIGSIPYVLILYAALYGIAAYVLRFTGYGRAIYAVGSNPEAARLTGINVTLVLVSVYTIAGLFGGLAGVIQAGRLAAAAPQVDPTLTLTVVAAVLIGGTSYTGGEGGLIGTALGVLFLGVVQNGLALTGVSAFWQGTVSGVILILAIGGGLLRTQAMRLRRPRLRQETPTNDTTKNRTRSAKFNLKRRR
jgi:ribose/xylose/arabinose/galactoside ABC-type transport system permease subunit